MKELKNLLLKNILILNRGEFIMLKKILLSTFFIVLLTVVSIGGFYLKKSYNYISQLELDNSRYKSDNEKLAKLIDGLSNKQDEEAANKKKNGLTNLKGVFEATNETYIQDYTAIEKKLEGDSDSPVQDRNNLYELSNNWERLITKMYFAMYSEATLPDEVFDEYQQFRQYLEQEINKTSEENDGGSIAGMMMSQKRSEVCRKQFYKVNEEIENILRANKNN